jgi:hypothetical protein
MDGCFLVAGKAILDGVSGGAQEKCIWVEQAFRPAEKLLHDNGL